MKRDYVNIALNILLIGAAACAAAVWGFIALGLHWRF